MDSASVPRLAKDLNVSLPTAHRILDREGVPSTGKGIPRRVPENVAERLHRSHTPMLTVHEARVLAALRSHRGGIGSARKVGRVAGVSPTTASKALRRLMGIGLVQREDARMVSAGHVTRHAAYRLDTSHRDWPLIRQAVDSVVLPRPSAPRPSAPRPSAPRPSASRSDVVPRRFWHLFWNADPSGLRVDEHGVFIARRMLNAPDLSAAMWALENVPRHDVMAAVAGRGTDARTRAFALNYFGSGRVA